MRFDRYMRRLYRLSARFVRSTGRWIGASIREPNNIPAYLTAIFTALLAIFAYEAWEESTRGTRALEGQLRAMQSDQRPYVTASITEQPIFYPNPATPQEGQVAWNWHIINFGRGVAYRFQFSNFMKLGNGHYELSYGRSPETNVAQGFDIPPGKPNFATVVSKPGIKLDEFNDWLKKIR